MSNLPVCQFVSHSISHAAIGDVKDDFGDQTEFLEAGIGYWL